MSITCTTEHSKAVFNDEARNEIRLAARKPLVYLDSCVWIDIAERAEKLAQKCCSLVHSGKVVFPVSFSTVNEVIEQPTPSKRSRVAELMDELSKGICFRPSDAIHALEADLALPVILGSSQVGFEREKILTWMVEFAANMKVQFPSGWDQAAAEKFTRLLASSPEVRSVKWIVDHSPPGQMRLRFAQTMERYVEGISDAIANSVSQYRHLAKDIRRKKLLLDERVSIVKKIIAPRMSRNLLSIVGSERLLATIASITKKVGE